MAIGENATWVSAGTDIVLSHGTHYWEVVLDRYGSASLSRKVVVGVVSSDYHQWHRYVGWSPAITISGTGMYAPRTSGGGSPAISISGTGMYGGVVSAGASPWKLCAPHWKLEKIMEILVFCDQQMRCSK